MTAGRSLGAAGRAMLFQIGLIIIYILFIHLYGPDIKQGDIELSIQSARRMGNKLGEYQQTTRVVQYTLGAISIINLSFLGMELLNAGKCIQKHWRYFGVEH